MLTRWFQPLATAIDEHQRWLWTLGDPKRRKGVTGPVPIPQYGPYMLALPPETLAVITIHEVINQLLPAGGTNTAAQVTMSVGRSCNAEVNMMKLKREDRRRWERLNEQAPSTVKVLMEAQKVLVDAKWDVKKQVQLGAALIDLLIKVATVAVPPEAVKDWNSPATATTTTVAATAAANELGVTLLDSKDHQQQQQHQHHHRSHQAPPSSPQAGHGGAAAVTAPVHVERDEQDVVTAVAVPAFKHEVKWAGRTQKRTGFVTCHDVIPRLFEQAGSKEDHSHATFYPMLVPPRPWTAPERGAYVKQHASLVRTSSRLHSRALRAADMPLVYEGINALSRVPWRINNHTLKVVKQAWEAGGNVGDLPPVDDPVMPSQSWIPPRTVEEAMASGLMADGELAGVTDSELAADEALQTVMERRHRNRYQRAVQHNRDLHSLRCDFRLKLGVAEMLRHDRFFFPFNMDFRGRAYPIPPHLNHLGSDVCRGLLLFDKPRRLGTHGLRWLKIHMSNLMGVDKVSFDDREAYIDDNLAEVYDSAANPLGGNGWWLKADYPWQALSTAREIVRAIDSGDPESYLCALPVHQDGSCNGLQHYAALGRDLEGGSAVNLTPADKPQDVYTVVLNKVCVSVCVCVCVCVRACVAEWLCGCVAVWLTALCVCLVQVLERIELDAGLTPGAPDTPPPGLSAKQVEAWKEDRESARFVRGKVTRKVCKQSIMTSVYGVTLIGARAQIAARLKEVFEHDRSMPVEEQERLIFQSSMYLARTTLHSLRDMFSGADAIKVRTATHSHKQPHSHTATHSLVCRVMLVAFAGMVRGDGSHCCPAQPTHVVDHPTRHAGHPALSPRVIAGGSHHPAERAHHHRQRQAARDSAEAADGVRAEFRPLPGCHAHADDGARLHRQRPHLHSRP